MIPLISQLEQLERNSLVRKLPDEELAYQFKHALTQESACESILVKKRRAIHKRIAEAYEQQYADRLDEFAAALAQHYAEAGDDAKTVEYAARAGDVAARVHAQTEAIAQYTRALAAARRAGVEMARMGDLYARCGRALELIGRHGEAATLYQELETLAHARGDRGEELNAAIRRATVYTMSGNQTDAAEAFSLSSNALARSRELGNREAEARALWSLMLAVRASGGDLRQAIEYGEQSAAIARELGLRELLAYALHDLGLTFTGLRENDRALDLLAEANTLWETLDNKPLLANVNAVMGSIYWMEGKLQRALQTAQEAYTIDHAIGNQYDLTLDSALVAAGFSELGQFDEFLACVEECEQSAREGGAWGELAGLQTEAARVCLEAGDWARARALADQALDFYDKAVPAQRGRVLAVIARMYLAQGDLDAAAKTLEEIPLATYGDYVQQFALGIAPETILTAHAELALLRGEIARASEIVDELSAGVQSTEAWLYVPSLLHLRARILLAQNRVDEAEAALVQACEEGEKMQARCRLLPVLIALIEIKTQRDDLESAASLQTRAREIVEYITVHSPADLRASFLNRYKLLSAD